MLALRRLRCPLYSVPACQTRLLRTKPQPVPTRRRGWEPTLHEPSRSTEASRTTNNPRESIEPHGLTELLGPTRPKEASATNEKEKSIETGVSHSLPEFDRELPRDDDKQHESGAEPIKIDCSSSKKSSRATLHRLQDLLNRVNDNNHSGQGLQAPLWNTYLWNTFQACLRCRRSLPFVLPRRAWEVLWKSLYMDMTDMPRRHIRLAELYNLFVKTKRFDLNLSGPVAYRLEQEFMAGSTQKALESWKSYRDQYPEALEFLDTGARLYALAGFPDRAREIMDKLLALEPDWHVSLMMVVFRAHTSSHREQHLEEARQMYVAIKTRIGGDGSTEPYDNCLIGFLEARSLPDARQVFRDMAEAGLLDYTGSEDQIRQVVKRLARLHALAAGISDMSAVALDAIAVLPVAYHGYVFSDWMKHSYLQDAPQVVAQILDLMVERGYQPETAHFNFLLRALFRTKKPDDIRRAESIGWKMVEEARLLPTPVDTSAQKPRLLAIKEKLDNASILDPDSPVRAPAANSSTFALLMSHHAERAQWEHVDFLTRQLREANVAPNCIIMNVLLNNKIRQGQFLEAWQIYKTLTGDETHEGSIFPDGESMRCLWKMLQLATSNSADHERLALPTPRDLLRETMEWRRLIRKRADADRFTLGIIGQSKNEAHRLILHCFSQHQDLTGALVALHVLHWEFNVHPTLEDALRLCKQIAWVPMDPTRRQSNLNKTNARNVARLTSSYERIRARKLNALYAWGGMEHPMTEADTGAFELEVISVFVRIFMLRSREPDPEAVELMIQKAREASGVPNLPTGDALAFDLIDDRW